MKKRKKLSPAEIERVGILRAKNWPLTAIAKEIGCSHGSVYWCCLREGFEPSKPSRRVLQNINSPYERNGHIVRPFTKMDDERLLELEASGVSETEIARALGRKPNSIRGRLMTLARRAERMEAAA